MNVQIFIPCFIDQLYPNVGFNMEKVLIKAGCSVDYNVNQTCCGQPAFNAGYWGEAKDVCSKFLKDFEGADYIVGPSASCVGFVRNYYGKLFDNSSVHNEVKNFTGKIFELSEFLVNVLKFDDFGASLPVKGLEMIQMADNETCCGFGGAFAVKFEPISVAMADQKVNNAEDTGAEIIISTDMSCLMHIDGVIQHKKSNLKVMHLADVLASGW